MAEIFGVDLRGELFAAFDGQLGEITLTKIAREPDPANITGPDIVRRTEHQVQGEFLATEERHPETLVFQQANFVFILGGSLPDPIVPEPGDEVEYEGQAYTIITVNFDLSRADYRCRVVGRGATE